MFEFNLQRESLLLAGEMPKHSEETNILSVDTPFIPEGAVSAAKTEETNFLVDTTSCSKVLVKSGKCCTTYAITREKKTDFTSEKTKLVTDLKLENIECERTENI